MAYDYTERYNAFLGPKESIKRNIIDINNNMNDNSYYCYRFH